MSNPLLAMSLLALSVSSAESPQIWLEEGLDFLEKQTQENQTQAQETILDSLERGEGIQPDREELPWFAVSRLVRFSGGDGEETLPRPVSGAQFYQQRMMALKRGKLYTRLPRNSFYEQWKEAREQPSYEQWKRLLKYEALAIARGQGQNQLNLFVGDSLSAWFPSQAFPKGSFWLNQSISGENTQQLRQRLHLFAETRPQTIYVMVGINDLRQGVRDETIVQNYLAIAQQLKQQHPQAKIVLQSLLPTRQPTLNRRINRLNHALSKIAERENLLYLNLHAFFVDDEGQLKSSLTTDGIHLTPEGYEVWQQALEQIQSWLGVQYQTFQGQETQI
ncbi:GDSL-type esterase/lipase family protein [Spirulina sp. CS-785/01]|uniref:DUF459 domain-containing protein n=1 Tax=Spirulina sp. CS-785/01 TaxID=3021716 RepID=UPI00232D08E5|nr:GDSL-type esterase/lipase family protein [Spirulina sp. CS-785/01]MDB9311623.1 GDSL-type esterase/lipase family protein [Spirulina sp. CS-785/01]